MEKALLTTRYDIYKRARIIELSLDPLTIEWFKSHFRTAITRDNATRSVIDESFTYFADCPQGRRVVLENVPTSALRLDNPRVRQITGKIEIKADWMPDFRASDLPW